MSQHVTCGIHHWDEQLVSDTHAFSSKSHSRGFLTRAQCEHSHVEQHAPASGYTWAHITHVHSQLRPFMHSRRGLHLSRTAGKCTFDKLCARVCECLRLRMPVRFCIGSIRGANKNQSYLAVGDQSSEVRHGRVRRVGGAAGWWRRLTTLQNSSSNSVGSESQARREISNSSRSQLSSS